MAQSTWQKEQIIARRERVRHEVEQLIAQGLTKTDAVTTVAKDLGLSTVTIFSDLKDDDNDQ